MPKQYLPILPRLINCKVPDVSALPHPMAPQRPHRGLVVAQVHGGDDAPGAGERAPRTMRKDFIGGDFDWSLAWSDFAMGRNPETPVKLNDWDSEFKEYVRSVQRQCSEQI